MKSKIALFISVLICGLLLVGCSESKEKKQAKKSIESYMESFTKSNTSYTPKDFSNLYIVEPIDRNKIPDVKDDNFFFSLINRDDFKTYIQENQKSSFNQLQLRTFWYVANVGITPLILCLSNICSANRVSNIIRDDKIYRKYKTGGKRYIMFHFFSAKNNRENVETGLCFMLDSSLNVIRPYYIENVDKTKSLLNIE